MLKLIIGVKGTGKTKTLISLVNEAAEKTEGTVVCMERE
jgi:ABC-type proline/glycine betaine transport system ATPase subunit